MQKEIPHKKIQKKIKIFYVVKMKKKIKNKNPEKKIWKKNPDIFFYFLDRRSPFFIDD